MRAYRAAGDSYQEASRRIRRQTSQYARGEAAKKAVARQKADLDEWLSSNEARPWADPLAQRLTELVSMYRTADLETLRAKIEDIRAILLEYRFSLPDPDIQLD